jgi:hypothetical protein
MSSAIARELYAARGTHALPFLSLAKDRVVIAVAPWSHPGEVTEAAFEGAELRPMSAQPDTPTEDIVMPWDIIGFDSTEEVLGRWEFLLNGAGHGDPLFLHL